MGDQEISTATAVSGTIRVPNMTLRDYFAAKAMQAMVQNANENGIWAPTDVATDAYEMADAMIAERAK